MNSMYTDTAKQQSDPVSRKNRYRIWELQEGYLCSIIGTCLSTEDQQVLLRKTELSWEPSLSDYGLHTLLVDAVHTAGSTSRTVNKYLNKKYKLSINQAKQLKTSHELTQFWHHSKEQNRLAGSYWAVLTHPLASSSLCRKLHGEIHMLSHLATRQTATMQNKVKGLRNKINLLRISQTKKKRKLERQGKEISTLRCQLKQKDSQLILKNHTLARMAQRQSNQTLDQLQAETTRLTNQLQRALGASKNQTASKNCIQKKYQHLQEKYQKLQTTHHQIEQDNTAMEQMHQHHFPSTPCPHEGNCTTCTHLDLCGRSVLYVGGQHSLVPHYRQIVEDCGGVFMHHDGGKEDQRVKLAKMLTRADAVICPISCVSHDACLRAKKLCKSQIKPFITMRSPGLSSLARGLELVADTPLN